MPARRMLLFLSLVLLVAAFSSALSTPREDSTERVPAPLPAAVPTDRVTAELPASDPVVATVGDIVELRVATEAAERVELRDLGVDGAALPGTPATLLVLTDRAGRFPVTLRFSGQRVGTLEVREP